MSWLSVFRGNKPSLSPEQAAALAAFEALPAADSNMALESQRFVVVDVESTGLNLTTDKLIAIGAVTAINRAIHFDQGLDVVLQQETASAVDNILIHGIDGTTQTSGRNPADALLAFLSFIGNAPLVAYHAPFDRSMINKATRTYLGMTIKNPWIDLAFIAPALLPELAKGKHGLDDWTGAFDIVNTNRHNAVADALATAQLLLVLMSRAGEQNHTTLRDLIQIEKAQQWLTR
jgi:DNA polymerase-3 subunit epsilon